MKRQSIQNAYRDIRPDGEAKERMLNNILLSSEIPPAGKDDTMKRRKMKPVLIAAVIALMVLLMGCAVIALSLQEMKIGEFVTRGEILDSEGNVVKESEISKKDVISLQGHGNSPNILAAKEWYEFYESYDVDGQLIGDAEAAGYVAPKEYDAYFVFNQTMQDKVDEIAEKYGLKLAGEDAMIQSWENEIFFDALGLAGLHNADAEAEVEYYSGYFFACGNFKFDFDISLKGTDADWPYEILTSMRYADKEYLDTVILTIEDISSTEQWAYKTAAGSDVLIAMDEEHARIFCDREDAFISVLFDTAYVYDSGEIKQMTKADVEAVADVIDFNVKPQKPDMEIVNQKLAESNAQWQAKQDEKKGQHTYFGLIQGKLNTLEHPEILYYCQMDANEDGIEDLVLGTKDEAETAWTIIDGYLNFPQMTDENWAEVDRCWAEDEIKPITEYFANSANQDKYGYQEYIEELLSMEHPENSLYVLTDINSDGTLELLIGDKEQLSFVWRVKYYENGNSSIELLSFSMTEQEFDTLNTAWPDMEKKPVTEYFSK